MTDKIDDGGPAFPFSGQYYHQQGMSLRDWFAGQALSGVCNNPDISYDAAAHDAYAHADAMIAERNRKP